MPYFFTLSAFLFFVNSDFDSCCLVSGFPSPGIDNGALGTGAKRKERLEMEFKSKTRQKHGHKYKWCQG